MVIPGGVSDFKPANDEVQQLAESVKDSLSTMLSAEKRNKMHPYKAVSYRSQVVAGVNYFIKVEIDNGKEYLHLRVHKPLGENAKPSLARHQESHSAHSDLTYF
jgi:cystatin-A/B